MKRDEAQELVGCLVIAWTSAWGEYIGWLREVTTPKGRPWRGKVEILSIEIYPHQEDRMRYPFRLGGIYDFGNSSIKPFQGRTDDITDYFTSAVESAQRYLTQTQKMIQRFQDTNRTLEWWMLPTLERIEYQFGWAVKQEQRNCGLETR